MQENILIVNTINLADNILINQMKTPTIEETLDQIYQVIADKTLSIGCEVTIKPQDQYWNIVHYRIIRWDERPLEEICAIIWHPVMIWDIISYIKDNHSSRYWEHIVKLLWIKNSKGVRTDLRKPIEKQPDSCIDYVYSLLSSNQDK